VASGFGHASLEHELTIAVGAIDATVVSKIEINAWMAKGAAAAIATHGVLFDFDDFGRLDGHRGVPDLDWLGPRRQSAR
tara:strand:+ start:1157 stop:1393 length:237 start_codon:yes stop_codon:yes gene_type:complete